MTGSPRIVVDIERIVLDGVALDAAGLEAARTALVGDLTTWLTSLDPSTWQSMTTARTTATIDALDPTPDGRALGRSLARAIRETIGDGTAGFDDGGASCPPRLHSGQASRPFDPSSGDPS